MGGRRIRARSSDAVTAARPGNRHREKADLTALHIRSNSGARSAVPRTFRIAITRSKQRTASVLNGMFNHALIVVHIVN
jgi:hypothetical protein